MEEGAGLILPVVYGVKKDELPEPLGRLQAMSLASAGDTRQVFQRLIDNFGFGSLKGFRHAGIKAKLPKYSDLKIAEVDLESGTIYAGPYAGYSDDELSEVLFDEVALPAWNEWRDPLKHAFSLSNQRQETLRGRLIHFRAVDEQQKLPPGTSKRLLVNAFTDRLPAVYVRSQSENTVRFTVNQDEYRTWLTERQESEEP